MGLVSRAVVKRIAIWACSVAWLALSSGGAKAAEPQDPPAGLRVFYTGHSFHMFVPNHIDQLVKAAGIQGHVFAGRQSIGGSRVIQHWELADDKNQAKRALAEGKADVFTMAAHVAIPDEGITKFTELGLAHNPNLRLLVQASWFPFDVAAADKRIRDNAQRDAMQIPELQAAIDEWRTKLEAQADELNLLHGHRAVFIVPVGDAVVRLRSLVVDGTFPGVKTQSALFTDPIGHAGPHVQALAAYCNYAAIYRVSPEGLQVPPGGLDEAQHAILQRLAWETVAKYPWAGIANAGANGEAKTSP